MEQKKATKKQTKKLTPISEFLTPDAVKNTIENLIKDQPEITDLVCVFRARDGSLNWKVTEDTSIDTIITMLEHTKISLLTGNAGEEE